MIFFLFNLLKKILIIKSFSKNNNNIYNIIIYYFKIFFFEIIKIRYVNNLIIKKKKNFFFYIAHIDVVDEGTEKWFKLPFKCKIFKKRIINRGIVDMKGALICALFLGIKTNFILTNDEESISIFGTQYIIKILKNRKKKILLFVSGEPTSTFIIGDYIKISRRGSFNLNLIFLSKSKHSAYIGINTINFFLNIFKKKINKFFNKNETIEYNNIFCGNNSTNLIKSKLFFKINFRFLKKKNIFIIKKKIIKFFFKKNFYLKWILNGIPFICYKNFFLKKIFNSILFVQFLTTKINFLGGTSDLRYCFYFYKKSFFFELGLINLSIHKINENSLFDDLIILKIIYKKFFNGIK